MNMKIDENAGPISGPFRLYLTIIYELKMSGEGTANKFLVQFTQQVH